MCNLASERCLQKIDIIFSDAEICASRDKASKTSYIDCYVRAIDSGRFIVCRGCGGADCTPACAEICARYIVYCIFQAGFAAKQRRIGLRLNNLLS